VSLINFLRLKRWIKLKSINYSVKRKQGAGGRNDQEEEVSDLKYIHRPPFILRTIATCHILRSGVTTDNKLLIVQDLEVGS
jgi:hypothetical protein